jgi:2-dehydropantoate 2-reductase
MSRSEINKQFCIFGTGAIGGLIAANLKKNGYNISCIARSTTYNKISKDGITVISDSKNSQFFPTMYKIDEEIPEIDYLFITVKANNLPETIKDLKPHITNNTTIITGMNGIPHWYFSGLNSKFKPERIEAVDPNGVISHCLPPEKIIGSVIYPAAKLIEPGVIKHISGNKITIGEPSGMNTERINILSKALNNSEFRAPIKKNIRDEIWIKLLGNVAFNPLSVLTGGTLEEICKNPETRSIVEEIMIETRSIGEKLGASFPISIEKRIKGAEAVGDHKTSMLQDFEANKPMEFDAIVTSVQELGKLTNSSTKVLDVIAKILKQKISLLNLY